MVSFPCWHLQGRETPLQEDRVSEPEGERALIFQFRPHHLHTWASERLLWVGITPLLEKAAFHCNSSASWGPCHAEQIHPICRSFHFSLGRKEQKETLSPAPHFPGAVLLASPCDAPDTVRD